MTTPPDPDIPNSPPTPAGPNTKAGRQQPPRPGNDAGADELVADIEVTRAELGDTIDALGEKFDVKAQTQHGLHDARQRVTAQARTARERGSEALVQVKEATTDAQGDLTRQARVAAFAAAALVAVVAVVTLRRRSR